MQYFYWLIENGIAGCSRPGEPGQPGTRGGSGDLDTDLAWLRDHDIEAVLSLTETPLPQEALERYGLEALHLPVPDMTAPHPEQFQRALDFIDGQRALGRVVAVHCKVGQGRTATVLAAYLIRSGRSADEAIAELRALCPGAIGSPEQEQALHAFARRRDWIL
jgi:atypical dual specificity phosphatase